jgi:hypothetical protein
VLDEGQKLDVWSLERIERRAWTETRPDPDGLSDAVESLRRIGPALASLDRKSCRVQLYLSSIRDEEQGGFDIPAELIAAAGAAGAELIVSILVMWYGDEEEAENTWRDKRETQDAQQ